MHHCATLIFQWFHGLLVFKTLASPLSFQHIPDKQLTERPEPWCNTVRLQDDRTAPTLPSSGYKNTTNGIFVRLTLQKVG
jgi:ABC-type methionine transport system ATPase subunit